LKRKLLFHDGFNFSCTGCGRCCRDWNVHVDRGCYEKVKDSPLYTRLREAEGEEPFKEDTEEASLSTLRKSGACVFLDGQSRCMIHGEIGYGAKPLACRQFPVILRPTPDGVFVGVSFYCPSCHMNTGLPLSHVSNDVESWLNEYSYTEITDQSLVLMEGLRFRWEDYLALESFTRQALERGSYSEKSLRQVLIATAATILSGKAFDFSCSPSGSFGDLLKPAFEVDYGNNELFEELCLFFTFAVVGVMESDSPSGAKAVTEAAMGGTPFKSLTFGKEINMPIFAPFYMSHPLTWKEEAIGRYMEHLLFRKYLAGSEPVFHRLAVLDVIYNLIDFYLYLSAFQDGEREPVVEDLYSAFAIIEKGFTAHTRTMVPFFKAFAGGFMDLLDKIKMPDA
jgi:Fe-S-cluster containining protein